MKHRWMPIFWGDFLANTMGLSAQEIGAYFLLIAHAWEHGGSVPFDQAQRIARVDNRHWRKVWQTLEPYFELEPKVAPRWLHHGRVLTELAKADELSNKRRAAAKQKQSKSTSFAGKMHMQKGVQNGGIIPSKNIHSSFPLPHTRATGVDNSETQPEETPQGAGDKKASEVSRAELEAIYAAKPKQGP